MPNLVRIFVEAPDALLNAGMYDAGAIVRLQSCATETGIYADESTAALVTGTRTYTLYDADGTSSTWYRTRYENAGGTLLSDWSAAFQVGGEQAGYICSLDDVRQRLGLATTDTTNDEELSELISQATDEIIGYTGRQFSPDPASGTKTLYLDYPYSAGPVLFMPRGVRSVTYLGYATTDQPDATGTYTEIASTYYYLDPSASERDYGWPATRITLASGYSFYGGKRTVKVTGSFGWAAVPPTVERIGTNVVIRRFIARQSGRGGTDVIIGSPDSAFTTLRDLSPEERGKLDWYRVRYDGAV